MDGSVFEKNKTLVTKKNWSFTCCLFWTLEWLSKYSQFKSFSTAFLYAFIFLYYLFCNLMPHSGCSDLHGVNPNQKRKHLVLLSLYKALNLFLNFCQINNIFKFNDREAKEERLTMYFQITINLICTFSYVHNNMIPYVYFL